MKALSLEKILELVNRSGFGYLTDETLDNLKWYLERYQGYTQAQAEETVNDYKRFIEKNLQE